MIYVPAEAVKNTKNAVLINSENMRYKFAQIYLACKILL